MRQEKQYLLDDIKDQITNFDTFVVMKYASISANVLNQFRKEIAANGGNVEMSKKRLFIKACNEAGIQLPVDQIEGHVGFVFGNDIETAKAVFKFCQTTNNNVQVLAGQFEGKLYSGQDVEMLSKLPTKDEMRAQLLSTLEAPMAQTLSVMDALLSSVIYCLDNKGKEQNQETDA